jgi:hypothetical protein
MDKEQIIKKLKDNWIKPGKWKEYERAKRIICPDMKSISNAEYEFRIRILSEYMGL